MASVSFGITVGQHIAKGRTYPVIYFVGGNGALGAGNLDLDGFETSDPRGLKELLTPGRSVGGSSNLGSHRSTRRSGSGRRSGRSSGRRSGRSLDRQPSIGSIGSDSDTEGTRCIDLQILWN